MDRYRNAMKWFMDNIVGIMQCECVYKTSLLSYIHIYNILVCVSVFDLLVYALCA